jgi:hypothetical protein
MDVTRMRGGTRQLRNLSADVFDDTDVENCGPFTAVIFGWLVVLWHRMLKAADPGNSALLSA